MLTVHFGNLSTARTPNYEHTTTHGNSMMSGGFRLGNVSLGIHCFGNERLPHIGQMQRASHSDRDVSSHSKSRIEQKLRAHGAQAGHQSDFA